MPHGENKHPQKEIFLPSLPFFKTACLYAVPERERPIPLPCFCRLFSFSSSPFCLSLRRGAKEREKRRTGLAGTTISPSPAAAAAAAANFSSSSFFCFQMRRSLFSLPWRFSSSSPSSFWQPDFCLVASFSPTTRLHPPPGPGGSSGARPLVPKRKTQQPRLSGEGERNYLQTKLKREGKRAMYAPPGCIIIQKGRHRPRIELSLHRKEKAFSLFLSPLSAASEFRPTLSTDVPIQTSGQRIGAPSNLEQEMEKLCL